MSDLTFVRLKFPRLIPKELIEAVKGRTFHVEQFLEFQEAQRDNPLNFLYALKDTEGLIHGFLWAQMNALDDALFVNTYSVDKQHWGRGEAINWAIDFLRDLKKKTQASRVFWMTTNEKFFAKRGFTRSKNVLMEYIES